MIEVVHGNITDQDVDIIVNAANPELLPGGGVCGAIHAAGGPAIAHHCQRVRRLHPRGVPVGQAVATTGGMLDQAYVIHAVGPIYDRQVPAMSATLLESSYRQSIRLARDLGASTIAFPAISCGIYGYPLEEGARHAIFAALEQAWHMRTVRFVLWDEVDFRVFSEMRQELCG